MRAKHRSQIDHGCLVHPLDLGEETLWQYQLTCQLPTSGVATAAGAAGKMLALSYVKNAPLSEQDRQHWEAIKTSVRLLDVAGAEQDT